MTSGIYQRSPYPLAGSQRSKARPLFYENENESEDEDEDDDEVSIADPNAIARRSREQKVLVLQWTYMVLGSFLALGIWAIIRTLSGRR
ncbi:uncharacterized protein LDX57_008122 [Aspergillus melleus]|uniref:uncharacterized protein n=1 Tax=Aspergillus melleus TaxID=138277 RepID=UPI001E8CF499|nr:uncharacterized protein LDX57_008122 [Aspergillus melleus]KAH8430463.1 hypothetical protein LDX57_008122 [Aspergillus melleus]